MKVEQLTLELRVFYSRQLRSGSTYVERRTALQDSLVNCTAGSNLKNDYWRRDNFRGFFSPQKNNCGSDEVDCKSY